MSVVETPPEEDLGDEAGVASDLSQVVQDYMPLVRHAVNRVVHGHNRALILEYEDLVSCGMEGLIGAFHAFEPGRGVKFSTYALPRIRGAILDALRAAHPLPRSLQKTASDIERAHSELSAELGRYPTREEIARRLGVDIEKLDQDSGAINVKVTSIERGADYGYSGSTEKLIELVDHDASVDPQAAADTEVTRKLLREAVSRLPAREREIVRQYYFESRSLKSIGQALAISESRASQLRHRAVRWLRKALAEQLPEVA